MKKKMYRSGDQNESAGAVAEKATNEPKDASASQASTSSGTDEAKQESEKTSDETAAKAE